MAECTFVTKTNRMKKLLLLFCMMLYMHASAQTETSSTLPEVSSPFESITLFPNPTSEIIFIRNGDLIDSYTIFNLQGQEVQRGVKNAQIISLIDLPIGYYFIELKIGETSKRMKIQKY